MTIKPGDKFKTRDGREVEIDRIDTKGTHPVIGRMKVWQKGNWTVDGKWFGGPEDHYLDLISPPQRTSVWMNYYPVDDAYALREEADNCATDDRTHVLQIITENGEPVDVKIHKVER